MCGAGPSDQRRAPVCARHKKQDRWRPPVTAMPRWRAQGGVPAGVGSVCPHHLQNAADWAPSSNVHTAGKPQHTLAPQQTGRSSPVHRQLQPKAALSMRLSCALYMQGQLLAFPVHTCILHDVPSWDGTTRMHASFGNLLPFSIHAGSNFTAAGRHCCRRLSCLAVQPNQGPPGAQRPCSTAHDKFRPGSRIGGGRQAWQC